MHDTSHDSTDTNRLLDRFGAEPLTDNYQDRFPGSHPFLDRGLAVAGRDLDRFLSAVAADEPVSVVTGVGPSGPMHLGHAPVFYFARYLQRECGAHVYIPLSDDEKLWTRDQTLAETRKFTRENLRDILAVGFDPERTRILVDTADSDITYPLATAFATAVTTATREAVYGTAANIGASFYPAMQIAHLLLPQLARECGPHATTVPVAIDQDPHVRVCRDVAGKDHHPVEKPGAILSQFLPALDGGEKSSASTSVPMIRLNDDPERARELLLQYAHSGGQASVEAHRKHGGDPEVDVAFQYLRLFFEPDETVLERLRRAYRAGDLLTGDLKAHAADRIGEFLREHQVRRPTDDDLTAILKPYLLTDAERERALERVGFAPSVGR